MGKEKLNLEFDLALADNAQFGSISLLLQLLRIRSTYLSSNAETSSEKLKLIANTVTKKEFGSDSRSILTRSILALEETLSMS